MIPVSIVVYWMMILWLKEGDTCVNSGLLNDDILIKTNVSIVDYWMMILWLKEMCKWWIKVSSFSKPSMTQVSPYFNQNIIIQ
jgi:hypothetical protein